MLPNRLLRHASMMLVLSTFALTACSGSGDTGSTGSSGTGGGGTGGGSGGVGATGGGGEGGLIGSGGFGGTGTGGASCEPPDMLIALDRTLTMHRMPDGTTPVDGPDYQSSKWWQAITAIEGLVTPELDQSIRFGLELWPKEEAGCITLAERVLDTVPATNPQCSDGEVLLSPALGASGAIAAALDPATTKICISTPTGAALLSAADHLGQIKKPERDQYILLVTDGADWEQSCPLPDPVGVTQQLAKSGIKTFVLGFSATGDIMTGGVGAAFLNDMACAGMTAKDFATGCMMGAEGYVAVDPAGSTLYLQASDGAALATALDGVAASVCCDCVH